MFLAGKVEETPRPLKDVILVSYEINHKKDPAAMQKIKQKVLLSLIFLPHCILLYAFFMLMAVAVMLLKSEYIHMNMIYCKESAKFLFCISF